MVIRAARSVVESAQWRDDDVERPAVGGEEPLHVGVRADDLAEHLFGQRLSRRAQGRRVVNGDVSDDAYLRYWIVERGPLGGCDQTGRTLRSHGAAWQELARRSRCRFRGDSLRRSL